MSLSFMPALIHHGKPVEGVQVACVHDTRHPDQDRIIYYYQDSPIDIKNELDTYDFDQLIEEFSATTLDEHNVILPVNKVWEVEDAVRMDQRPSNRLLKLLFNEMKKKLDRHSSRLIDISPENQDHLKICPLLPIRDGQRSACFISGSSGSGKSTMAAELCRRWILQHPGCKVYLFSRKESDPVFDNLPVIRIPLDKAFATRERRRQNLDAYADSLCIFDDFTKINDPAISKAIMKLKDDVFELGRADRIDTISIQHKTMGNRSTLGELLESNMLGLFPRYNPKECANVLKTYFGLDTTVIDDLIHKSKNRWMVICRPDVVICENFIKIL